MGNEVALVTEPILWLKFSTHLEGLCHLGKLTGSQKT